MSSVLLMLIMLNPARNYKDNGITVMVNTFYSGLGGKNLAIHGKFKHVTLELEVLNLNYRVNPYSSYSPEEGIDVFMLTPSIRLGGLEGLYLSFGIPFVSGKDYASTGKQFKINVFPGIKLGFGYTLVNFTGVTFQFGINLIAGNLKKEQYEPYPEPSESSLLILPLLDFSIGIHITSHNK